MFFLLYIHFGERKALRRDPVNRVKAMRNKSEIQEVCWRIWGETVRRCLCRSPLVCLQYPVGNHAVSATSGREHPLRWAISIVDSPEWYSCRWWVSTNTLWS